MSFWYLAVLWFFLAMVADFIALRIKVAVAITEIIIGVLAAFIIAHYFPAIKDMGASESWIVFLASTGAVLLTFLAGAELDPNALKAQWKEVTIIGLSGFFAPFLGCAAIAYYVLHWSGPASWLAGVALSTTSVAVVYAVLLELGLTRTKYGNALLGACFVNDLGTVLALGFIFSPFTYKMIIFVVVSVIVLAILPKFTRYCFERYGKRHSEMELKFLLLFLFGLGSLAFWSGSEPVLPAYIMGMLLATTLEKDHTLVKRVRALTFGFLTPFFFLRTGSYVSLPALAAAPMMLLILFLAKMVTKAIGVYPAAKFSNYPKKEAIYTTLLMSTGLTFGTISALYGLTHNVIDKIQYSALVTAVIASAIIPTIIANAFYLPKHLIVKKREDVAPEIPGAK